MEEIKKTSPANERGPHPAPEFGRILREARLRAGLSIADVEAATRIHSPYIEAVENEDYSFLPPAVYIIAYVRKNNNLLIGRKTACALKESIGSALPGSEATMAIVGRDVVSGLPIETEITATQVYEAIQADLNDICTSIKMTLEHTPPELARDIIHSGIYITGGSSRIQKLDELFANITGIKVNTCEDPEECVARGLIKLVSDSKFKHLAYTLKAKVYK